VNYNSFKLIKLPNSVGIGPVSGFRPTPLFIVVWISIENKKFQSLVKKDSFFLSFFFFFHTSIVNLSNSQFGLESFLKVD